MLEKTSIHRVMLALPDGFSVSDIEKSSAALPATVRKTVQRAVEDGLLQQSATRPAEGKGPPEKLYAFTPDSRTRLERETSHIYATLLGSIYADQPVIAADVAADGMSAAFRELDSLKPAGRPWRLVRRRLTSARASLKSAAEVGDRKAETLLGVVNRAIDQANQMPAEPAPDAIDALCARLLADIEAASALSLLDMLPDLVPALRREAARHRPIPAEADTLVGQTLSDLLAGPLACPDTRVAEFHALSLMQANLGRGLSPKDQLFESLQDLKNTVSALKDELPAKVIEGVKNEIADVAASAAEDPWQQAAAVNDRRSGLRAIQGGKAAIHAAATNRLH